MPQGLILDTEVGPDGLKDYGRKGYKESWRANCIERCMVGSEEGGWKRARKSNALAAYPTRPNGLAYLNRVGQLNRIWPELHCPNPSRVVLAQSYAFMVTIGHTEESSPDVFPGRRRYPPPTTFNEKGIRRTGSLRTDEQWCETMGSPTS